MHATGSRAGGLGRLEYLLVPGLYLRTLFSLTWQYHRPQTPRIRRGRVIPVCRSCCPTCRIRVHRDPALRGWCEHRWLYFVLADAPRGHGTSAGSTAYWLGQAWRAGTGCIFTHWRWGQAAQPGWPSEHDADDHRLYAPGSFLPTAARARTVNRVRRGQGFRLTHCQSGSNRTGSCDPAVLAGSRGTGAGSGTSEGCGPYGSVGDALPAT